MMKKMLSLLTVAALLAQGADMQAMDTARQYYGRAKAAVGRYVGAPAKAQAAKLAAWAGPFLSETGAAIQARDFQALRGIAQKYKAQARTAGGMIAVALASAVGAIAYRLTRRAPSEDPFSSLKELPPSPFIEEEVQEEVKKAPGLREWGIEMGYEPKD
jgi:hypothetical protein